MTAAVLLALVAGADLVTWRLGTSIRAGLAVGGWVAAVLVAAVALGDVAWFWAGVAACVTAAWILVRRAFGADVAAVVLVVATGALLLVDDARGQAPLVVAGAALAVLLTHAANDVCRDVLVRAGAVAGGEVEAGAAGAGVVGAGAVQDDPAEASTPVTHLKGGRFIGPLERWLIAALALVGAQAVIVGLMAAKGIGRFPEISGDRRRGAAAEEFLVGSLVSWALAGLAAAALAVLRG
ncbi:hypothetical protein [Demequina pelophila]|uniref:hypothetical protein n=1 Tax=Demequina pelophila TaxID=1638984 RepID=UPI000782038E|nr:hypothetical protein [Demequina pelophila]